MAHFNGSIKSDALGMRTNLTIITPADILNAPEHGKVVYLLHGLSDDAFAWEQNAQLPQLADTYNLTFILPEVQRSFYTDMAYGLKYFTYVAEELPQICKRLFGISGRREDTYVMGLSMGGYGALKCALKKPEQYAGCGAFSALTDIYQLPERAEIEEPSRLREIQAAFGMEHELFPENDLYRLAKECETKPVKPKIFMACGTEDFIYQHSVKFRDFITPMDFDFTYKEWSGVHEWYLWNKALHLACAHFFPETPNNPYCNIK